jgi:hypothetical protein
MFPEMVVFNELADSPGKIYHIVGGQIILP